MYMRGGVWVDFEWDDRNRSHVERHIAPEALEAALEYGAPALLGFQVIDGELRRMAGATAPDGRVWVVIYVVKGSRVRPITAFPANEARRQLYENGGM
jgi:uncharacterized DUF497 family protein